MSLRENDDMVNTHKIKIGEQEIEINDHTKEYKKYDVLKYILKYLYYVPIEDLKFIGKINIYDDSPSYFPKDRSGGLYPLGYISEYAELDLYLNHILAYMPHISKDSFTSKIKDKFYLMTSGKLFIASTLFHEIGHHKYDVVSPKEYRTIEEQEKDATDYENELLWKAHPFIYRNYNIFNRLYKYLHRRRLKKAQQIQTKITCLHPPEYLKHMGLRYLENKEYEKAISEFDRLISFKQDDVNAYINRGVAKVNLEKYNEAILDFSAALNIKPEEPIAYYNRGFCHQSLEEFEKAIRDYTKAIEINYQNVDVFINRSQCYDVLGEKEKAEKDLQEAIKRGYKLSE